MSPVATVVFPCPDAGAVTTSRGSFIGRRLGDHAKLAVTRANLPRWVPVYHVHVVIRRPAGAGGRGGGGGSPLDPPLALLALLEGVLDGGHLGDQVGDLD